jgi:hypothetical protein
MYGEEFEVLGDTIIGEGVAETYISKMMVHLNELYEIVRVLNTLLKNIVNQLHALYNKGFKEFNQIYKKIILSEVFDALGELLVKIKNLNFAGCVHQS